jgi:maltose alpha-D-glucosyltransferase/alpha-amylase
LLNWTERMLRTRKELPEVGWGTFAVLDTDPEFLAIRYDWRNNSVLVVHNLGAVPKEVRFRPGAHGSHDGTLVNLISDRHSEPDPDGLHCVLMEPYGYRWFRIGGLDYLLRRTEA